MPTCTYALIHANMCCYRAANGLLKALIHAISVGGYSLGGYTLGGYSLRGYSLGGYTLGGYSLGGYTANVLANGTYTC